MSNSDNTVSLKHAIDKLIKAYRWDDKLNEVKLAELWENIMGPVIGKKTRNIYIQKGVLYVKVESPALREELGYNKTLIRDKVNEALKQRAVKEVKVQ